MNKLKLFSLALATCLALPSCMTTYDRNGRPVQSVDPGLAVVGIVGAGLIGAALASDNNHRDGHHRSHNDSHYQYNSCDTGGGHGDHRCH
ncbi:MAG: hypothetical protein ABGY95_11210 [Rubritalea sp.]|uniref:hypothetical protein n=1 Tax=Rubritalea sp. TaxID=2109375 RepID=UPI0032425ED3